MLITSDGSRIDLHANSQAHMLPASEHGILLSTGKVAVEASPKTPRAHYVFAHRTERPASWAPLHRTDR